MAITHLLQSIFKSIFQIRKQRQTRCLNITEITNIWILCVCFINIIYKNNHCFGVKGKSVLSIIIDERQKFLSWPI